MSKTPPPKGTGDAKSGAPQQTAGGGGEHDAHHAHREQDKGGGTRPASKGDS